VDEYKKPVEESPLRSLLWLASRLDGIVAVIIGAVGVAVCLVLAIRLLIAGDVLNAVVMGLFVPLCLFGVYLRLRQIRGSDLH
jgi:hypothetical protein